MIFWILIVLYFLYVVFVFIPKQDVKYIYQENIIYFVISSVFLMIIFMIVSLPVVSIVKYNTDKYWEKESTYSFDIASFKDSKNINEGRISGNFLMFSGYFNGSMKYVIMKRYDDGALRKITLPSIECKLYETDEKGPLIEWDESYLKIPWLFPGKYLLSDMRKSYYRVYIPKNTIIKEFEILPN